MAPMAIADKVALLVDGQVERIGAPQEVIAFARSRMRDNAMKQRGVNSGTSSGDASEGA